MFSLWRKKKKVLSLELAWSPSRVRETYEGRVEHNIGTIYHWPRLNIPYQTTGQHELLYRSNNYLRADRQGNDQTKQPGKVVAGEQDWAASGMHNPVSARSGVIVKESLNRTGHGTKKYSRELLQVFLWSDFNLDLLRLRSAQSPQNFEMDLFRKVEFSSWICLFVCF